MEEIFCACGCGKLPNIGKFYIHGHNPGGKSNLEKFHQGIKDGTKIHPMKNKKHTETSKHKMSVSLKGHKAWNTNLTKDTDDRLASTGRKISNTRKRKYFEGKIITWNKNLTKETDSRVASGGIKIGEILKFKYSNGELHNDMKKAREIQRIKILSGEIELPYSHRGFREDLGHSFRSSWEANVARILETLKKEYKYESKECRFNTSVGILVLDFYLPEEQIFLEPKGYLRPKNKEKLICFIAEYPEIAKKVYIIDNEVYNKLTEMFKNKIRNWE